MPAITLLQLQRRRSDRVNVHLDDEYAFSLALDLAAALHLGQELDPASIEALRTEDAYRVALDRGAAYLQARPRSEAEVRRRLAEKACDPDAIDRAIARMQQLGYLDDGAFARWWVANRLQHRPRGRLALRSELRGCGVADEHVEAALRDVDDEAAATSLAISKAERYAGDDRSAFDRWLGSHLRRRGFDYGAIRHALDRAWKSRLDAER